MAARDSVLVTGAYGLVGRPVVERLVTDGFNVVATAHHTVKPAARRGGRGSVDLTHPAQVNALVAEVSPTAIVHLAAVIPPHCYANRAIARAVNVDATAALVRAAAALPSPPASCTRRASPYTAAGIPTGSRSAHRDSPWRRRICTAATRSWPKTSCGHRIWNGRSFGSAASTLEPLVDSGDFDSYYFGALLPEDNRVHTVDSRDVARPSRRRSPPTSCVRFS